MQRTAVLVALAVSTIGLSALELACGSGGSGGTDGGASGASGSSGTSGASGSSGTSGASGSSGTSGVGSTCAQAGGECLTGIACKSGTYADNGPTSCPPPNGGDGPNRPCCLPATNDAACKGKLTGTKPASCGGRTCGAGTNHCQVIAGGPAGSGSSTACGTASECDACPTCECLLSTSLKAECGSCTVDDAGVATLSCSAP